MSHNGHNVDAVEAIVRVELPQSGVFACREIDSTTLTRVAHRAYAAGLEHAALPAQEDTCLAIDEIAGLLGVSLLGETSAAWSETVGIQDELMQTACQTYRGLPPRVARFLAFQQIEQGEWLTNGFMRPVLEQTAIVLSDDTPPRTDREFWEAINRRFHPEDETKAVPAELPTSVRAAEIAATIGHIAQLRHIITGAPS